MARAAASEAIPEPGVPHSAVDGKRDAVARVFDLTALLRLRSRIGWTLAAPFLLQVPIVLGEGIQLAAARHHGWSLISTAVVAGLISLVLLHRFWRQQPIVRRAYLALALPFLPWVWVALVQPGVEIWLLLLLLGVAQMLFPGIPLLAAIAALKRTPTFETARGVDRVLQDRSVWRGIRFDLERRAGRVMPMRAAATVLFGSALFGLAINLVAPGCGLLWSALSFAGGAALWRRARRHSTPRANEIRELDRRPPILLLRSFNDDNLDVDPGALRELDLPRLAAEYLNGIGPVVALPAQNERLQRIGPYRVDLEGKSWTEVIQRLVSEAAMIVLICGRSEGLAWELDLVMQPAPMRKTVILFPSVDPEELARRWTFLASIERFPALPVLRSIDPNRLLLARVIDESTLDIVTANAKGRKSYVAALAALTAELPA
jgi:hypothetical protein